MHFDAPFSGTAAAALSHGHYQVEKPCGTGTNLFKSRCGRSLSKSGGHAGEVGVSRDRREGDDMTLMADLNVGIYSTPSSATQATSSLLVE